MHAKSLQSCMTLCDCSDCSPPSSSVHGILQAGILEWLTMPSSRGSSPPSDLTHLSCGYCTAGRFFTTEPPGNRELSYSKMSDSHSFNTYALALWGRAREVVLPLFSFYHGLLILTYLFKSFPTWITYIDVHRIVLYLLTSYRAILKSVTFPTRSLSAPEVVPGSWVGFGMTAILGTCCMLPALHPFSGMPFLHLSLTGYMSRRWTSGLNMRTTAWCL